MRSVTPPVSPFTYMNRQSAVDTMQQERIKLIKKCRSVSSPNHIMTITLVVWFRCAQRTVKWKFSFIYERWTWKSQQSSDKNNCIDNRIRTWVTYTHTHSTGCLLSLIQRFQMQMHSFVTFPPSNGYRKIIVRHLWPAAVERIDKVFQSRIFAFEFDFSHCSPFLRLIKAMTMTLLRCVDRVHCSITSVGRLCLPLLLS